MDYKSLDWKSANELKDKSNAVLITQLDFNFSNIYMLNDSSYLIMPLNPFGHSILTGKKQMLDKWISEQHFPIDDEFNKFYSKNKDKIDNLNVYKEVLKKALCNYAFKEENKIIEKLSDEEIDNIYKLLRKRKKYEEYKLNFMILVGDHILSKQSDYHWGLLKIKQYLNPITHLVLVKNQVDKRYYDVEDKMIGKWGYVGVQYFLDSISDDLTTKPDEFSEIVKVF